MQPICKVDGDVATPEATPTHAVQAERTPDAPVWCERCVLLSPIFEKTLDSHSLVPTDVIDRHTDGDDEQSHAPTPFGTHLEPYTITRTAGIQISLWTQLLALLERTGRQLIRQRRAILGEIFSPLIFVVVLIILDCAFGVDSFPEDIYADPVNHSRLMNQIHYRDCPCYNDTEHPIEGLHPCTHFNSMFMCDGDESNIPVRGLCHINLFRSPVHLASAYLNNLLGVAIALPTLDSIILHQWMAKKADLEKDVRSRAILTGLSSAGIGVAAATRVNSITHSGLLYFAPAAKVPGSLIEYFQKHCELFKYVYGGIFTSVEEAHAIIGASSAGGSVNRTWGLIIINDITDGFDVRIQMHTSALPSLLAPPVSLQFRGGFAYDGSDMFIASGFLSLQRLLHTFFYENKMAAGALTNVNSGAIIPYTFEQIYPVIASYPTIGTGRSYLLNLFPPPPLISLVMTLSLLYPFAQVTKRVVLEKELLIRESMYIMGLKRVAFWVNFSLSVFLEYTLISILVVALMCATIAPRSNPFLVLLILLEYCLTLIPLSGLVSSFFSRTRVATAMSPIIYLMLSMPIFTIASLRRGTMISLLLLSPTVLASLLATIFTAEAGSGFQVSHLHHEVLTGAPSLAMKMLALDFLVYSLLMLYLDAVLPQQWSRGKPPLFFILEPWAWLKGASRRHCRRHSRSCDESASQPSDESWRISKTLYTPTVIKDEHGQMVEGVLGGLPTAAALSFDTTSNTHVLTGAAKVVGVRVDHLCKSFKRSGQLFPAVDNVSWNMYRGEIAVLIGPNGAGKSTTINMITGMLTPDSGDCFIEGYSVTRQLAKARHEIGYCPQHNILLPDLTCREHLEFYGKIKGLRGAQLEDAVVDILRAVDLVEKKDVIPARMTGGEKRKLSLAIAFVGRNRVVLLDEPTSGMDTVARRHTWYLLRAMSRHHTIILTTHYMDEADLLGDNIAILTEGTLHCAGSGAFLRRYAGVGHTLHFDTRLPPTPGDGDANIAACSTRLHHLVKTHLADATLVRQTDTEVEYELRPGTEAGLPELLKDMESRGNLQLHIRSCALRAPTLESVLLHVAHRRTSPLKAVSLACTAGKAQAPNPASRSNMGSTHDQHGTLRPLGSADRDTSDKSTLWDAAEATDVGAPVKYPPHPIAPRVSLPHLVHLDAVPSRHIIVKPRQNCGTEHR